MQASLAVDHVWIGDGELTVDCGSEGAPPNGVGFGARRASDGARVAGTAVAEGDRLVLRLDLAQLTPAGPGAEDWRLAAAVAGASIPLTPGAAYDRVPDPGLAFTFPVGEAEAGGSPRRFRPEYDHGALSIRSMPPAPPRRAPMSGNAPGRRHSQPRAFLIAARGHARMLAHRLVHAGFTAGMRRRPAPAPGERRRIVILLGHAWGIGGTTRTCLNVAGHLAQHHDVTVLSIVRYRDTPHVPFPPGVEVVAVDDQRGDSGRVARVLRRMPTVLLLPLDWRMSRWATLWTDLLLVRAVWRQPADVVMATRPALNALVPALARPGVTVIGQEHINLATHRETLREEIRRRYRGLDVLVTLVEQDREDYQALLGDQVRVACIPNAVPELPGPPAALDDKVVVAVGRLTRQKGFERLVRAFAEVVRVQPDWTLRICGSGRQRRRLQRIIIRRGLHNHVLLLGPVEHVEEQLAHASVFALSSRFEGMPLALIEAMSKGLPVVAFDCPTGPADVVEHGRSGLLVPDGDVDGLARALLTLIADERLRHQLGQGAAARASELSMDAVGRRWDTLLAGTWS